MTGRTSVSSTSSNRRDKSGNSATCSSSRSAVTISGAVAQGALPSVTSVSTSLGCSDNDRLPPPRTVRSRPVAAFTRSLTGAISVLTSTV